jgi:hypothetical protein
VVFCAHYSYEHRPCGFGLHTPAVVHYGYRWVSPGTSKRPASHFSTQPAPAHPERFGVHRLRPLTLADFGVDQPQPEAQMQRVDSPCRTELDGFRLAASRISSTGRVRSSECYPC